uniref:Antimicrobial peptide 2 n=1 Tax=Mirabilis jalapa TaxID=3538 RepID=AMP2_MIRJA|nr:RecName: Full=Antimicrobial peptide 2; AltName: Full=MJ-AMP2; Short=AMP2; Flags: Precursor [Mirabilis jalapa]AAA80485.1 antimicrobial peptide precursor [Mirabilis jalapa]
MAKVPIAFLKFVIVLILFIAMSGMIEACIGNGGRCNENVGPPYCCSGFCLRQPNQGYGVCRNR